MSDTQIYGSVERIDGLRFLLRSAENSENGIPPILVVVTQIPDRPRLRNNPMPPIPPLAPELLFGLDSLH